MPPHRHIFLTRIDIDIAIKGSNDGLLDKPR